MPAPVRSCRSHSHSRSRSLRPVLPARPVRLARLAATATIVALMFVPPGNRLVAQVELQPGDIGVVTDSMFGRLRAGGTSPGPVDVLLPSAFGPSGLDQAGIAWLPGSDDFVVSAGPALYRVHIAGGVTPAVTDITPALGGPGELRSPDVDPGTGALWVWDKAASLVHRFRPPFVAGMTSDLALAVPAGTRSVCLDTRSNPPGLLYSTANAVSSLSIAGKTQTIAYTGSTQLDDNPLQAAQAVLTRSNTDNVFATTGVPGLVQNLNLVGLCGPVALAPNGVAYDSHDNWTWVFAVDGLNPSCYPTVIGPNHVVGLPPASGPFAPKLATNPSGSGLVGAGGMLSIVRPPVGLVEPYGLGCQPAGGAWPHLDTPSRPTSPGPAFSLSLEKAPAGSTAILLVGLSPLDLALPSGCHVLVETLAAPFAIGTVAGSGKLDLAAPIPAGLPDGTTVHLQALFAGAGPVASSNGLLLLVGP